MNDSSNEPMQLNTRLQQYTDLLDEVFEVRLPDGSTTGFKLVEASGRNLTDEQAGTPGFSLIFQDESGTVESHLPQGTYDICHEKMSQHKLFVVPIGPDPVRPGIHYQAVFG